MTNELADYAKSVPNHIAFIMDGNGRWASRQGFPRIDGHRAGAEVARRIVEACGQLGVEVCSLFAFSTENWNRPDGEVAGIMELLEHYLDRERDKLFSNNVQLEVIGDKSALPGPLTSKLQQLENDTKTQDGLLVQIALSYSGRDDIVHAVRRIGDRIQKGQLEPTQITRETISEHTMTRKTPDPDLVVRTAGERRVSNFFLWQIAYSELYFSDVLWPDFGRNELLRALDDYNDRNRTYGRVE